MKKCLCLFLLLAVLLCSCGGTADSSSVPVLANVSTGQLSDLFEENLDCVENLLVLGALPHGNEPVQDGHVYPVKSVEYRSYAELQAYLQTVYTAAETTRLLEGDGKPLYLEVDGVLCVDVYRIGGKDYDVDWKDFTVTIDETDDKGCRFTVTGHQPAGDPEQTEPSPYSVSGSAVYENGRLVLEKILY